MGSKPRRQKRAATPRPTPTSVEHATIDANEALTTVVDPRSPEDFATAFADAFLYVPEDPDPAVEPIAVPAEVAAEPAGAPLSEAVAPVEPPPARTRRSRAKKAEVADEPAAPKKPKASGTKRGDRRKTVTEATDAPAKRTPRRRKTDNVVAEASPVAAEPVAAEPVAADPSPVADHVDTWVDQVLEPTPPAAPADTWVDLVLEPTPPASKADEWVDQVLEPVKIPIPRPRPTARPATKSAPATAKKSTAARPAPSAKPSGKPTTGAPAGGGSRWWIVAPAIAMLMAVVYMNRPAKGHDPLPAEIVGPWKTDFWRFKQQTLEFLPDTVVLTLTDPVEGRYPITKVETSDAGRETAISVTYRQADGTEKTLDVLADKDPTTALRFRAHEGVIWTRPEP